MRGQVAMQPDRRRRRLRDGSAQHVAPCFEGLELLVQPRRAQAIGDGIVEALELALEACGFPLALMAA